MKNLIIPFFAVIVTITSCTGQDFKKLGKTATDAAGEVLNGAKGGNSPLSNDEVINGLREALTVGTNQSATFAAKVDGFYKNPGLFIPFPPEAQKVKDYANKVGMSAQVEKFEMTLNRAAEEAAKDAAPVFVNAIKGMSIGDGFAILKGTDDAATKYLKDKTTAELTLKFTPIVQAAIDKVELTKYWNPIITSYNKVPFVQKQNPDLTAYVTERAMQGLFKLIAEEELKIRKDPVARVTDILKRVFGSLGTN
ncbi:MAG: DUF4197 domain-containing protein [Bacteroidota bacterium]|nr:DUF4197 domain-containing protein [Bacteroidota bacterium]